MDNRMDTEGEWHEGQWYQDDEVIVEPAMNQQEFLRRVEEADDADRRYLQDLYNLVPRPEEPATDLLADDSAAQPSDNPTDPPANDASTSSNDLAIDDDETNVFDDLTREVKSIVRNAMQDFQQRWENALTLNNGIILIEFQRMLNNLPRPTRAHTVTSRTASPPPPPPPPAPISTPGTSGNIQTVTQASQPSTSSRNDTPQVSTVQRSGASLSATQASKPSTSRTVTTKTQPSTSASPSASQASQPSTSGTAPSRAQPSTSGSRPSHSRDTSRATQTEPATTPTISQLTPSISRYPNVSPAPDYIPLSAAPNNVVYVSGNLTVPSQPAVDPALVMCRRCPDCTKKTCPSCRRRNVNSIHIEWCAQKRVEGRSNCATSYPSTSSAQYTVDQRTTMMTYRRHDSRDTDRHSRTHRSIYVRMINGQMTQCSKYDPGSQQITAYQSDESDDYA